MKDSKASAVATVAIGVVNDGTGAFWGGWVFAVWPRTDKAVKDPATIRRMSNRRADLMPRDYHV